jgi:ATP-dependent DNA helicase DinG
LGSDSAGALLGNAGPLASRLPGFIPRQAQQEMADAVSAALSDGGILVAEAGTGTGKTFAYLTPALISGLRVVVSTGTRALQDQLFRKDVPLVREALGATATTALLKGRSNYLCVYRAERLLETGSSGIPPELMRRVSRWARRSRTGDLEELPQISGDPAAWRPLTSTVDNCLGQDCPYHGECFLVRARREAQKADLVVVNHHLLCADMTLRERGMGELLPAVDAVVVDEAHQLPEVARAFFGAAVARGQLAELARDALAEAAEDMGGVRVNATRLTQTASDLHRSLGDPRKSSWSAVSERPEIEACLDRLVDALRLLRDELRPMSDRSRGIESCARRSEDLLERLQSFRGPGPADAIRWLDNREAGFTLHLTSLDVGQSFSERLGAYECAWVFTSATLAVGEDFSHFTRSLGLGGAATLRWDSPFDFQRQALLYVPERLPDPNSPGYHEALAEAALPVLETSKGRAFLLFTSHRALRRTAQYLAPRLDFPLLVQGQAPRGILLERFRALGNAVLLGTASFWEGVDVRGDALSVVVIDRLPFSPPDDPVFGARLDLLRKQGHDPFTECQLPEAVISLKQGAGRLIRDAGDRGVLMLCDPRLTAKSYGRVFLRALPPMPLTRSLSDVQEFLARGSDPS